MSVNKGGRRRGGGVTRGVHENAMMNVNQSQTAALTAGEEVEQRTTSCESKNILFLFSIHRLIHIMYSILKI